MWLYGGDLRKVLGRIGLTQEGSTPRKWQADFKSRFGKIPSPMRRIMKRSARKSDSKPKRPKKTINFLQKPECSTCRKARRFLEKRGYKLNYRDIINDRLSASEIEKLIGRHDHEDCLLYTSPSPRDLSTSRMPSSA